MNYVCLDGKFVPASEPVFMADNKGFRYGDGVFETIRLAKGKNSILPYHFDRFFAGLDMIGIEMSGHIDRDILQEQIWELCRKNKCETLARARLSGWSGNGGINEGKPVFHYLLEAWPAPASIVELNENGLVLGIFPHARKSMDIFSSLKSANYLPYILAARYAKSRKWNESLVLNTEGRIADSSIANIFIEIDGKLWTPPVSEGCVAGVMRRFLLENEIAGERVIYPEELDRATEIFLSNAMHGIRWVGEYGSSRYKNDRARKIFSELIKTIW